MNANNINQITKKLLKIVSGSEGQYDGAYNIRQDSGCAGRVSTKNVQILPQRDGNPGLEIHVAAGAKDEKVYIPACVSHGSVSDVSYNDFYIGEDAQILITAGCGVHTDDDSKASHNGIHRFFIGRNAQVYYDEKHVGTGEGKGKKLIDPVSEITLEEGASLTMDTVQLGGVDETKRITRASVGKDAKLIIRERLLTDGYQTAYTFFDVDLAGENAKCDVVSRSVARGHSRQEFISKITGRGACTGHSACDAILSEDAVVTAAPQLDALSPEAALIHEAAIGKIAGEQILKLRTLGLSEEEAEKKIIEGFLK